MDVAPEHSANRRTAEEHNPGGGYLVDEAAQVRSALGKVLFLHRQLARVASGGVGASERTGPELLGHADRVAPTPATEADSSGVRLLVRRTSDKQQPPLLPDRRQTPLDRSFTERAAPAVRISAQRP